MRNLVYKDIRIKTSEYNALVAEYTKFIKDNTGIDVTFWTVDHDFTNYETILDTDGDDVLRPNFLKDLATEVTAKYGDYGTDNVITLIHEDNWKSGKTATRKGIWGQNLSYKYGKYHIQYCRFDEGNLVNSLGTINHEIDHTFDALCQVEVGINLNELFRGEVDSNGNWIKGGLQILQNGQWVTFK